MDIVVNCNKELSRFYDFSQIKQGVCKANYPDGAYICSDSEAYLIKVGEEVTFVGIGKNLDTRYAFGWFEGSPADTDWIYLGVIKKLSLNLELI